MPNMKKNKLFYFIVVILVVSQVYSIFQIGSLKSKVQQTEIRIALAEDHLRSSISEIYSNVDRQLEGYTSLVTSCGYEVGEFNLQIMKVPVTFQLQPKILTETTKVFLKFGEKKFPMERQNTKFMLTKDFEIKEEVRPTIIIEDKGVQQFEEHDDLSIYDIRGNVFSGLSVNFMGETGGGPEWQQESYRYHMRGGLDISLCYVKSNNTFKDIRYLIVLDDEVIKTYEANFAGSGTIEIDDKFQMEKGQTLIGKVVAVDDLNFSHEYLISRYIAGEGVQDINYKNEKITASNGMVIYDFTEGETE